MKVRTILQNKNSCKKKIQVQRRLLDAVFLKIINVVPMLYSLCQSVYKYRRLVVQCLTRFGSNRAFTLPYLFRERRLQQPFFLSTLSKLLSSLTQHFIHHGNIALHYTEIAFDISIAISFI